jgi:hypothetical protein
VNEYKNTYIYDINNYVIEELFQNWDGSDWLNQNKFTYTYDGNNNNVELLNQYWDGSNWVNSQKVTYTYLNNNLIEYLDQEWDGFNWVNFLKNTYTYDVNNNLILRLMQTWDGSDWVNQFKYTFTYDGNNNRIEQLREEWDGSNWVNLSKYTYTYILTEVEQLEAGAKSFSLEQNYPNPFNPSTTIKFTISDFGFTTLKIYDVLGNEVVTLVDEYKTAGSYEVEWNAKELPSGVYFYQLKTEGFIETKKMILLK